MSMRDEQSKVRFPVRWSFIENVQGTLTFLRNDVFKFSLECIDFFELLLVVAEELRKA